MGFLFTFLGIIAVFIFAVIAAHLSRERRLREKIHSPQEENWKLNKLEK